ncbi:hypothetical protein T07_7950 [Trichinella nelsoni]|uniref:Uncharacterized protein n=1 Tax=Trichinella nelsoni TaxID=6336 RepID=A0A0V0S067_9BILA|nr:hypothetical protein T07_7950 [Trichinella nelsoni]
MAKIRKRKSQIIDKSRICIGQQVVRVQITLPNIHGVKGSNLLATCKIYACNSAIQHALLQANHQLLQTNAIIVGVNSPAFCEAERPSDSDQNKL